MTYNVTISSVDFSLLPSSTAPLQKAVAAIDASRTALLDVDIIRRIHLPDLCPVEFLPILAWEYSVDEWDPLWSVATKRAVVKASLDIHRHKGTAYAVEAAINTLGMGAEIREWFEYGGRPYRFIIALTLSSDAEWLRPTADLLKRTGLRNKNVRSRLEAIHVKRRHQGEIYVGGIARRYRTLRVGQVPKPNVIAVTGMPHVGTLIVRHRKLRIKGNF